MSKFVTYGATEMLDNDQKFIIDSDRTGPGSITAKDAASSFLSKWAGFETFEEAVQNTISNNQEFIDRDTAIRSETAELKKKIVTTFPAKDASGAVATFESEFEDAPLKSCIVRVEPVQDLHGYDHPWPAGGGKNKFNITAYTHVKQENGVTFTINDDGSVTLNGTATAQSQIYWKIPTDVAINYSGMFLDCFETISNGVYAVLEEAGGSYTQYALNNTAEGSAISTDISSLTNRANLIIRVAEGTQLNNVKVYPMIRSSSVDGYEPYSNECPITGWTECEVQRTGKNLLSLVESEMVSSGWDRIFPISLKAGTYIISCQNQFGASAKGAAVDLVDDNATTVIKRLSGYEFGDSTFVGMVTTITEEEASKIKNLLFNLRSSGTTYNDIVQGNIKLELGSTATDYAPYTGQTYPITFPTEAGTVYGGTLDVTTGVLTVTHKYYENAGTGNWVEETSGGNRYVIGGVSVDAKNMSTNGWCNICILGNATTDNVVIVMSNGRINLCGNIYNAFSSVDALKAYLEEHPLQLVYELATPQTYQLTPQEVTTLLGQNNIWSNTGDTAVEYLMSDVSWYVEKKLRAFQSILAGVEDSTSASKNYSANTYLIFNNDIYRVTKAITTGETIEEGVNVTKTTVAEQLMALAQA